MAIAYDSSNSVYQGTATTSQSLSHTCTGSNLILVVQTRTYDGDSLTGVTYNGVAMTEVDTAVTTGSDYVRHWILVNPATGANNVTASLSVARRIEIYSISFTGAKQTGQPDSFTKTTGSSGSATNSITTVADNCWVVAGSELNGAGGASTNGTNCTVVQSITDRGGIGYGGPKTPAGSFTQAITLGSSGAWAFRQTGIAPAADTVATGNSHNNLQLLGVS